MAAFDLTGGTKVMMHHKSYHGWILGNDCKIRLKTDIIASAVILHPASLQLDSLHFMKYRSHKAPASLTSLARPTPSMLDMNFRLFYHVFHYVY